MKFVYIVFAEHYDETTLYGIHTTPEAAFKHHDHLAAEESAVGVEAIELNPPPTAHDYPGHVEETGRIWKLRQEGKL